MTRRGLFKTLGAAAIAPLVAKLPAPAAMAQGYRKGGHTFYAIDRATAPDLSVCMIREFDPISGSWLNRMEVIYGIRAPQCEWATVRLTA